MMTGSIELYGGGSCALPPLLEWDVALTGGVPCDSFSLTCAYDASLAAKLERAWRVTLAHGETVLRAVVDETEIVQDTTGRTLRINGRGLAALLLDNEAEAAEYSAPALSVLLRHHAAPYGIAWEPFSEVRGTTPYAVASASSRWKALSAFTRYYGGFALRITPEGVLQPYPWKDGGTRAVIDAKTPLLRLAWRDRRYGVYSEVLVVDKVRKASHSVKNEAFLARGGSCRRVLYTPGRSTGAAMRYTGEYQISQSKQGARQLTAVLAGYFALRPGKAVRVSRGDIGITGDFYPEEIRFSGGTDGERTTLRMRRLEE